MKFYGNENETVLVKAGKVYLIQSVDFTEAEQYEELSELPENMTELDSVLMQDLKLPRDLA